MSCTMLWGGGGRHRVQGSWNYWVKILMERSQSLWLCSQRLMLMFSKLHFGRGRWLTVKYMLVFSTAFICLDFHTLTAGRWTTTASYWWPLNHCAVLFFLLQDLFNGSLVMTISHSDFFKQTIVLESFWPYVYSTIKSTVCIGSVLSCYTVGFIVLLPPQNDELTCTQLYNSS